MSYTWKTYYKKNKEKIKTYQKQYNLLNSEKIKEKRNTYYKEYYKKHKDEINLEKRKKYAENPEKKRKQNLEHYHNNKEYYLKWGRSLKGREKGKRNSHIRRLRKYGLKHSYTEKEWIDKKQATNGICPMCKQFVGVDNLTLDHINAISTVSPGFIYTIDDIQPLCLSCNDKKGIK